MRLTSTYAAGDRIEVDVDPAAWPYTIEIGGHAVRAFPDRWRDDNGTLRATAHCACPKLQAGRYVLRVRDRNEVRDVETVRHV